MPKASPIKTNFNGGQISPLVHGRIDLDRYAAAVNLCQNWIPTIQGPVTRRPGSLYISDGISSALADKSRLVPFEFNVEQAYVLEFGDQRINIFADRGRIATGAFAEAFADAFAKTTPVFVTTPYTTDMLFSLRWAQSADVLYLAHPSVRPKELTRTSDISWTLTDFAFQDGPYLSINDTTTTLVGSAGTGTITITASAVTGINDDAGFASTDVGRLVRAKNGANWAWAEITVFTDTTHVTAEVKDGTFPTGATTDWRLGLWSDTTGWPAAVIFYQDRLYWGGSTGAPQRIDGSRTGDYPNYSPTETDGTVVDDNAVAYTLNANNVNQIRWFLDDEKALIVGTVGGEWVVRPSTLGEALTPTNIRATRATEYGSADVAGVRAGRAGLFLQRGGRKLREFAYVFEDDGFRAPDVSLLAEDLLRGGIVDVVHQAQPQPQIWMARADGRLIGMAYEREQDVVGAHQHILGGTDVVVESLAVIPNATGDELWMSVTRTINGATVRYIEVLDDLWDESRNQNEAVYVDSSLTYSGDPATSIVGLFHLEGETVSALVDGAAHPDVVVTSGAITLERAGSTVVVGLPYQSDLETLRIEAGAADGTAQGKLKRIHDVKVLLHQTLGLKFGRDASNLDELTFRSASDLLSTAVPLFDGIKNLEWEDNYGFDGRQYFRSDQPFPATISALMPQVVTEDS